MTRETLATPLVFALSILASTARSQTPPTFTSTPIFSGAPVAGLAIADLDHDGDVDLAASTSIGGGIAFWTLGDGTGAFGPPIGSAIPLVVDVAFTDMNQDGIVDLLASRLTAVMALQGNGAGAFSASSAGITGTFVGRIRVGDLDADGNPDVVGLSGFGGIVSLRNDGVGGFLPPLSFPLGPLPNPFDIELGDLNGDGILDAVVAGKSQTTGPTPQTFGDLWLFAGTGMGSFHAFTILDSSYGTSSFPIGVSLGDANGDGKTDAFTVASAGATAEARVFLGDGSGGGTPHTSPFALPPVGIALWLLLGDVNADGHADGVVPHPGASGVVLMMGDGTGALGAPTTIATGGDPADAILGDLDGDGLQDVVVSVQAFSQVLALRNTSAIPAGTSAFGAGTPGCAGKLGVIASRAPNVGAADFGVATTGAPPSALGLGHVGDAASFGGFDPFAIGIDLHVDPLASTALFGLNAKSDAFGSGFAPAPIPSNPALAGATFFFQSLWSYSPAAPCDPSLFGLGSSKGLTIVVLP